LTHKRCLGILGGGKSNFLSFIFWVIAVILLILEQVFDAVHKLNSRSRKCLGFKTPYEVFEEFTGISEKRLIGYALMT
jgi:hypothetical protein